MHPLWSKAGFGLEDEDQKTLMNNRQAGRRRGRGGQRSGGNPAQGNGNRIDNRARGNAAQLLEKYKNLARDAQMSGDRVNTEYYLQFADHYFRVLNENRSRFEEQQGQGQGQRRQQNDFDGDEDEGYEDEGETRAEFVRADEGQRFDPREMSGQRDERPRRDRDERRERQPNGNQANGQANGNQANGYAQSAEPVAEPIEAGAPEPIEAAAPTPAPEEGQRRRRGRPRREAAPVEAEAEAPAVFDAAVLPPSLGPVASDEPAEKPRRRRRTPAAAASEAELPAAE
jgi:hypothetical protein